MKKALSIVLCIVLLSCNAVFSFGEGTTSNTNYNESLPNEPLISANIPNDTYYLFQLGLANINATSAWDITTGSDDVLVGIIDTGIDATHPDLYPNINQSLSISLVDNSGGLSDDIGHGTKVAGIIGAQGNNNQGIAGTSWDVSLVSLKIQSSTVSYNATNLIQAIYYAETNGISILNISREFGYNSYVEEVISLYSGLVICEAKDNGSNNDVSPIYPASYTSSNVIAVANSTSLNTLYSTSNYGATSVDLAAPGVSVYSTCPTFLNNNRYISSTGTSYSTAYVTGTAALIKSLNPSFSTSFIKQAILNNVSTYSALSGKCTTGGVLNAGAAVDYARHNCNYFISNSDHIDGKPGRVRVSGWAFDPNDSSESMRIHVYIGGSASSGTGEHYDMGLTDVTRNDVNSIYGITGDHGYNFDVHTDLRGSQEVNVYVVNTEWGTSKKIGSATVNIPTGNPQGHIDHVYKASSNKVYVSGWAFDYDTPFSPIAIHVYIGGSAGTTGAEGHALTTNTLRTDINSLYDLSGNHGFAHSITTSKTGTQEVYIYAINTGTGSNVCLGHQSVTI